MRVDNCIANYCEKNELAPKEEVSKPPRSADVDEILVCIGQFGRSQILLLGLFCIIFIPSAYQTVILSFIGNTPPWRCVSGSFECRKPGVFSSGDDFYEQNCKMNRSSWEFIQPRDFSIVTEWDLVCEKKTHSFLANSALFFGWAIGAIVFGTLSDRYGRKSVLFPTWAGLITSAFTCAFVHNFWLFFTLRLTIGLLQGGIMLTLFVLATELVGPVYRSLSGTTIWFAFTFAQCSIALQGWLVPNWRTLLIITTAPYIIILALYKFIPESVRWLRVSGKRKEAEEILKQVARRNKKQWPHLELSEVSISSIKRGAMLKDLFVPKSKLTSTVIQCFAWFVNSMVFFGISLASVNLGGNRYRNFALTSLVEVPASVIAIVSSNRLGRRPTAIFSMIMAGSACAGVAFIPPIPEYTWARVTLGMIGKLFITTSFDVLYVWSAELYPTIVRARGMGLLSVVSRCGGASAPWISQFLAHFHRSLPFGIMGSLSVVSAAMCYVLKETRGLASAETLDDCKEAVYAVKEGEAVVLANTDDTIF